VAGSEHATILVALVGPPKLSMLVLQCQPNTKNPNPNPGYSRTENKAAFAGGIKE